MSEEKEVGRKRRCASFEEPSLMKELKGLLEKRDLDLDQIVSRMKAVCCGPPEDAGQQKKSAQEKRA